MIETKYNALDKKSAALLLDGFKSLHVTRTDMHNALVKHNPVVVGSGSLLFLMPEQFNVVYKSAVENFNLTTVKG